MAVTPAFIGSLAAEAQLTLFPPELQKETSLFRNSTFADNKILPVHRWVPWIAGYSAQFVDSILQGYLRNERYARVLDPFCGVGTTLFQAALRGYEAIGFDINPYPVLASKTKLAARRYDLATLDSALEEMANASGQWRTNPVPSGVIRPPYKSRIPFFSPLVEPQVLHALVFINSLPSPSIANLFRTAFGATLVEYSNYSYEPSLGSRPGAGKALVEDADVPQVLLRKLFQIRQDIEWLQNLSTEKSFGSGIVIQGDFLEGAQQHLEENSVDIVITSPPYLNNYHYVRNTRPQLYWLDFISSPKEQRALEQNNFGGYWQTMRECAPLSLAFEHPKLEALLSEIRGIRTEKGAYGGPGWANYAARYFNDCYRFAGELGRCVRRQGVVVIVVGNSIIQGVDVRVEKFLADIGEMNGLQVEGIHCLREKRVGNSVTAAPVRKGAKTGASLSEFAVVFRKE